MNVLVLHGPNLNLLGEREPEVYGRVTLADLDAELKRRAKRMGVSLRIFQSNSEGALVDWLHAQRRWADALIINPGGLTHFSYVLRDAIEGIRIRAIEVHLSDVQKRELFRRVSVVREVCETQISGLGPGSYYAALELLGARVPD